MMRNKIKRILAMLLAILMITGTVYGDGAIGFRALAEVEPSESDGSESKIVTFQLSESIQGLVEGISFNNLNCKITGKDVDGNNLGPFIGSYDSNTGKIEVTISNYSSENSYNYSLEDHNYEIQEVNGTLNDGNPLLITKVLPRYGITDINASSEEMEAGNAAVFTAGVTNAAWSDKITWTVSGDGAQFVAFVNSEGAKIASTESVTGNSCTLSNVDSIQQENLPISITLTATDLNNGSINKQVTFKKINSIKISSVDPEQGLWNTPVTITAQVTPQEAGRVVSFYSDGTQIGESTTDEGGWASCSWTPSSGGQYKFTASVSGDDSYLAKTSETATYNAGGISQTFEVKESGVKVTYGDQDVIVAAISSNGDGITQNPTYEVSALNDVADCWLEDGQVKIRPLKAGQFKYQITKKGNESYLDATQSFSVTIDPKVIHITEVSIGSKPYDGNTTISGLKAYLNQEDFVNGEALQELTADGEIVVEDENKTKAVNVGKKENVAVTFKLPKEYKDKYVLKIDKEQGTEVSATTTANVTKRKLGLKIAPATISCIDEMNGSNLKFEDPENKIEVSNFVKGEEGIVKSGDFKLPTLAVDTSQVNADSPLNQEIANAVYAMSETSEAGNATDNYEFDFEKQTKGTLKLVAADISNNISDYISIDNDNSTLVYQDMNTKTIYYRKHLDQETTVAKFKIADSKKDTFTNVLVKADDGTERDVTADGLELTVNDEEQQTLKFKLKLSNDSGTKQTEEFDVEFICDDTKPKIDITIGKNKSVVNSFKDAITFGIFSNREVIAEIKVDDPVETDKNNSGLKSWSYCVINTKEDVIFGTEEITKENVEKRFEGKTFQTGKASSEEVSVGTDEVVSDNYIVFVYAEDNVGNSVLYSSNGIVIENVDFLSKEQIIIAYDENTLSKNKDNYFNSDVNLNVTVEGNKDEVYSGIDNISYTVRADGNVIKEGIIKNMEQQPNESIADLIAHYSKISTKTPITVTAVENTSKEIQFSAKFKDFAQNEITNTKTFYIDKVSPEITNNYTSKAEVMNEKYYNKPVFLKTEIQERFLDVDNDVSYTINGEEVPLQKLMENKEEYGISKISCIQSNNDKAPDESLTTISVTFEDDGEYEVSTSVKDMAGNSATPTDNYNFIIDQTTPKAQINYYNDKNNSFQAGTKENIVYLGEKYDFFQAKVTVDELNFTDNEIVNAEFIATAKNSKSNDILADDISNYKNNAKYLAEWDNMSDSRHVYTVDIGKDANYTFDFNYIDLAGNPVEFVDAEGNVIAKQTDYITLDRVKPSGTITVRGFVNGVDNVATKTDKSWINGFIESISFGLFGKNDLSSSMKASDEISGVKKIEYLVNAEVISREALKGRTDWYPYTKERIPLAANQNAIVYEKVTDKAGNIQYYSTDSMIADNQNPAPVITITPSSPAWGKGVYSAGDHPGFDVTVTDPAVNQAYSGLQEINYQITNGTTGATETGTLATFARNTHQQSWSGHVNIDPEKFYNSEVKITVKAKDWSTNEATYEETLIIDSIKPTVRFEFDASDVKNGKYYSNTKELKIIVEEKNFDMESQPKVESTSGSGWDFGGWSNDKERGVVEGIITFKDNTDYEVEFECRDLAGNESNKESLAEFTIDKNPPTVENSESSNVEELNGKYYKENVTLTTTITERCFDIDNAVIYNINGTEATLAEIKDKPDLYGVLKINEEDIVHEADEKKRDDSSKSTIKITFKDDKEYVVKTTVKDKADNSSNTSDSVFVIDKTKPKVNMDYYKNGNENDSFQAGTEGKIVYLGEQYDFFQMKVTVDELNFTDDETVNAEFVATAQNSKGKNILADDISNYGSNAKNPAEWDNMSESRHVYTVDIGKDANYTFDFNYTDLAGNPVEFVDAKGNVIAKQTDYITLDRVKPSGTITVRGFVNGVDNVGTKTDKSWINGFIESISFGLFGKNDLSSSMEASDEISGVKEIEYLVNAEVISREALRGRTDWHPYTERISLAANQNVIVYEKVTDKAGNVQYYSTDSMIADNQNPAPVITITPSSPAWGKGVYSAGDRPGFDVTVTDPAVNHAYSGLQEITYQITNGTTGVTETGTLATFARNTHQQSWSGHVNIDPEKFYSNDVRIAVSAKDWSTNAVTSETVTLKIDNKAPIVQFSFDKSDAQNGKYYKNSKTLTITVNERNFDASYLPKVTSSTGSGYSFSGWSSNGEIHTGVVTFSGDSDYSVTFDCYDLAGNKSNTETLEQFTVDKTLPVIAVSYDNKNVSNGKYYKAERTATITITEHNFRASEVHVTTTASNNGSPVSAPSVSGWSTSGDRHTATIRFASDADYTFDISYTDMAGNAAAAYQKDEFTVDLTNPELQITGVTNKSANKGVVQPVITVSDTNYTASGVSLTLTGANKGKISVDRIVSRASNENGQIITFRNFGASMDDIYTLTAKITDQAGNESTRTITFSVNRNGSTYMIDDATQKLLKSGFTNKPKDIVIQEINVDTLEFIELSYSKDGKVVKLKKGTDYTVKEEGGDGEWKKYTYTIFAGCFDEEGEYAVNIYSEDRAENITTNKVKEKSIEFIVDKTAPAMVVTNLENRGRYKENVHRFTLSVKDNMALSYVELYLDGRLAHTYKGDELMVEDGVIAINIDSKGDYQTVKLIAYDEAGNPTDPAEYSVLVTSNGWIQFYMNKPLFYGSIAAIVAAAGFLFFIFWKRRKREEEASR